MSDYKTATHRACAAMMQATQHMLQAAEAYHNNGLTELAYHAAKDAQAILTIARQRLNAVRSIDHDAYERKEAALARHEAKLAANAIRVKAL